MNPYLSLLLFTLSRIPVAVVLLLILGMNPYTPGVLTVSLALMLLIEAGDFLDGFLARRMGLVSEIGATLDPYADSTARLLTYAALAWAGLVPWLVPLAMAVRDVTVAYCRILITRSGQSASAMISGKAKAVVQAVGAYALLLGPVLWGPGFSEQTVPPMVLLDGWLSHPATLGVAWGVAGITLLSMVEYVLAAIRAAAADFPGRS